MICKCGGVCSNRVYVDENNGNPDGTVDIVLVWKGGERRVTMTHQDATELAIKLSVAADRKLGGVVA